MASDLPPDASAAQAPTYLASPEVRAAPQIHADANGFHFVVNGNTLLTPEEVRTAVEAGTTPKDAIEKLNAAYQRAGYFMVVIGGEVTNKLVALTVLQGRITEIAASEALTPYLRGLVGRDNLNRNNVIRATLQAEQFLAREGMRPKVSFSPAPEVGGTKMTAVEEPIPGAKPWDAGLTFGNLGSRYSSRYQWGATGAIRPGGGLEITAAYLGGIPGLSSDSSGAMYQSAAAGFSIVTPYGTYGATYQSIDYRVGESSAPLYPFGNIDIGSFTGNQLVYADDATRVNLTQAFTYVDNEQRVFPDTPDPFLLTDQHYGYFSLGMTFVRAISLMGQNGSFGGSATVLQGVTPRTGSFLPADPGIPNTRFSILQLSASYAQSLPAGFSVGVNLSGQYADTTVPQNQQWVLGGFGNLTAWLPAVIVGDSGGLARVNVQAPSYAWAGYGITGSAFVEAGLVRLHLTPANSPKTRTLADSGLSLTGTTPFGTTATLAYAWPIASRNVDLDALNRQSQANLYFTLSQTF